MLSNRFGNGPVPVTGGLMIAAGTALTAVASSPCARILATGVPDTGGSGFAGPCSYDWMCYADIALAIFAAIVHLPIEEKPVGRPAA